MDIKDKNIFEQIDEVIAALQMGDILKLNETDYFYFKNDRIYCHVKGSSFSLPIDEFKELYQKKRFYLYEETLEIDEEKDEAYYRYYRK